MGLEFFPNNEKEYLERNIAKTVGYILFNYLLVTQLNFEKENSEKCKQEKTERLKEVKQELANKKSQVKELEAIMQTDIKTYGHSGRWKELYSLDSEVEQVKSEGKKLEAEVKRLDAYLQEIDGCVILVFEKNKELSGKLTKLQQNYEFLCQQQSYQGRNWQTEIPGNTTLEEYRSILMKSPK